MKIVSKNIAQALVLCSLMASATILEINDKPAFGLWFIVVIAVFFTEWE